MADEGAGAADAVSRAEHLRHAVRWLGSPVTVTGLVLLVLNDHVLKPLWPGLVTGKLSDVAGMVVAPPLVALLLAAVRRVHRPDLVATVAAGVGFVVTKTTEAGAAGASWVWSLVTPTFIRADVTDLAALPALLLAWRAARWAQDGSVAVRTRLRLALGTALLPAAVLATAATSPCPDPHSVERVMAFGGRLQTTPTGWEEDLVVRVDWGYATVDTAALVRLSRADGDRVRQVLDGLESEPSRGAVSPACSRTQPAWCWRAGVEDPTWVERTVDGGARWGVDFALPYDEVERLVDEADTCSDVEPVVRVLDLAVVETPRGPVVAAALGGGGLALRSPTGAWARLPITSDAWDVRSPTPTSTPEGELRLVDPTLSPRPTPPPLAPRPTRPPRTQPGWPRTPPASPPSA